MNQRIGYARVSTDDQNLDMQRDALKRAGCSSIYEETASGKSTGRPELDQCRKALRPGDTLVVWRLDRLGRSLPDLVRIVAELEQQGIGFESITEKIETVSASGKLVFHVFAALAEFERNLIRERTHAGLVAARARGRAGGRKPKPDSQQIKEIKTLMRDPNIPVSRCPKITCTTLYQREDGVVPFTMKIRLLDLDFIELLIGHLNSFWINVGVKFGLNFQSRPSGRTCDQIDDHFMAN